MVALRTMRNLAVSTWMKRSTRLSAVARLWLLPCMSICAIANCSAVQGDEVDYLRDVKALLKERCFACHGALKQESDLRLDTVASMLNGGASGPVIVAGAHADSELVTRIRSTDLSVRMPPEGKPLSAEEVVAIISWIDAGGVGPADEEPERDPSLHWAFQEPKKVAVPSGGDLPTHPVDAFLESLRRGEGVSTVPEVEKSLLLRRLYLDVLGFPPTRAELHSFLEDESEDAWETAVDNVLASAHYGERWGRHWMDVWRYSDWYGLGKQLRVSQKHIWHWRDWIVQSLNDDKGYNRMVVEMLAGDELAPTDPETLRATGFLARNYYLFNRTTWLDGTIEHTSKAFLGLTVNCAKCHDHKYDPISQDDYYRLRAVFEPHQVRLDSLPGEMDLEKNGLPRVFDAHIDEPTYVHVRGNAAEPDKSRVIEPGPLGILGHLPFRVEPIELPVISHSPQYRQFVLDDLVASIEASVKKQEARVAHLSVEQKGAKDRAGQPDMQGKRFLNDDFIAAKSEIWTVGAGHWEYRDGVLHQADVGPTRRQYLSKASHPRDFVARLRFRILGGQKWKSIGMFFDVNEGRDKTVYMSGVAGGSKVQVSYNQDGKGTYPVNGKVDRPVASQQWYELRIAVRDKLVNVSIDGEETLAYEYSIARENGKFGFMAFDAEVEFDSVSVHALSPEYALIQPGKKAPLSPRSLFLELDHARKQVAAEKLRLPMVRHAFAAGRAQAEATTVEETKSDTIQNLVQIAATATRRHEAAVADARVAEIKKQQLLIKDNKKRDELTNQLHDAQKAHAVALEAIGKRGNKFFMITASLKALEGPAEKAESRMKAYPTTSTGRRSAFSEWIVDRNNPLPARVAVNHIWMRHFGQPLVESVTDFGRRAPLPRQHQLLDWLAVDFMDHSWSMKHLHRQILTSSAYRLSTSSKGEDDNLKKDAGNAFFWRRVPSRMESEVVRDSLLLLAGQLDTTMGGPTIVATNEASRRRSLYYAHSRDDQSPFLAMFDDADILRCYRRQESVVPQQALTMANSKVSLEMAQLVAAHIHETLRQELKTDESAFVTAAFETVLARRPSPEEIEVCSQTMIKIRAINAARKDADNRARSSLIHALFNHNDFITIR